MIRRLLVSLLLAFAGPASANAPSDYAYGWPLELPGEGAAWRVDLTPEVYAVSRDEDLRDVEVFDAKGRSMPLAPLRLQDEPPPAERVALPVFAIRRSAEGGSIDLRVQVARGSDRSIHRVDAQLASDSEAAPALVDHLVDASRLEEAVDALWLSWPESSRDERASFAVDESDDLDRWRTIVGAATVLELHGEEDTLSRRRIDLPPTRAPYLRLRALTANGLRELRVEAQLALRQGPPVRTWVDATLESQAIAEEAGEKRGVYVYATDAALPVGTIRIAGSDRSLARIVASSEWSAERWIPRASFTLIGLEQGAEAVRRNEAAVSPAPRARRWRIEATPPLQEPPQLQVALQADRLAFLPQGEAPFVLAAGSHVAARTDAPVGAAIDELRARLGSAWRPPLATLGERRALAGQRALEAPPAPLPWKSWILWGVLVAGALLAGFLALRLLRTAER